MEEVRPYLDQRSKKEQVASMFDNIANRYDFLNHFLSAGIDKKWRKRAVKMMAAEKPNHVLDVATGTGDLAIAMSEISPKVTGIDISQGMLDVGIQKIKKLELDQKITLTQADSENLPFEDNTFDGICAAFGVRNFENLDKGLAEMRRVLKPGGLMLILEFSQPERFPIKQLYSFYFKHILPRLGKALSKDAKAYGYLHDSVDAFPYGDAFLAKLEKVGLKEFKAKPLTFGIASIYTARK